MLETLSNFKAYLKLYMQTTCYIANFWKLFTYLYSTEDGEALSKHEGSEEDVNNKRDWEITDGLLLVKFNETPYY